MPNSEQNDEECDATDDDSSNAADPIKKLLRKTTKEKSFLYGQQKGGRIKTTTTKDIGSKTGHTMAGLRKLSWYHCTKLAGTGPGFLHSAFPG